MQQDVTLPQVVQEVAALRSRFDRDETFVGEIHSAVDANAVILAGVIARLEAVEAKATENETLVTQVRVDAEANDVRLDTQIRDELDVVTTRLGDELRAALLKVDESFSKLEATAQAASASASALATPTGSRPDSSDQWTSRRYCHDCPDDGRAVRVQGSGLPTKLHRLRAAG